MQTVFDTVCGLILGLVGLIVSIMAFVEMVARSALAASGIHGTLQSIVLLLLLVALIVLSFRIFGKVLALLVAAALLILLGHALLEGPHAMQHGRTSSDAQLSL